MCEKIKPIGFALRWPCDPQTRLRSVKVAQNGRSQWCLSALQVWKKSLKSLRVMSNINFFCYAQTDRRPFGQPAERLGEHDSLHRSIWYPYGSKMLLKVISNYNFFACFCLFVCVFFSLVVVCCCFYSCICLHHRIAVVKWAPFGHLSCDTEMGMRRKYLYSILNFIFIDWELC